VSGIGIEQQVAGDWLYDTLSGDSIIAAEAVGGVWDGPATSTTPYPILRFDLQSALTVRGNSFFEIMQNMIWLVRMVGAGGSYVPLEPGAQQIQSLLHGVSAVPVTDGIIESSAREQTFRQSRVDGGREFRHLGGLYRIYVQGS